MTISEIKERICDEYCRHPFNTETQAELNDICKECPLNELSDGEPCTDAVSREDALNCLNGAWGDYSVLNEVYERISKLPPVTQKPDNKYRKEAKRWKNKWLKAQKSGKWIIDRSVLPYTYTCNICDRNVFEDYDYCPFCGCAMKKESEE